MPVVVTLQEHVLDTTTNLNWLMEEFFGEQRGWYCDTDTCILNGEGNVQPTPLNVSNTPISTMWFMFLKVQPPLCIGWFPNHHYFSRGLS